MMSSMPLGLFLSRHTPKHHSERNLLQRSMRQYSTFVGHRSGSPFLVGLDDPNSDDEKRIANVIVTSSETKIISITFLFNDGTSSSSSSSSGAEGTGIREDGFSTSGDDIVQIVATAGKCIESLQLITSSGVVSHVLGVQNHRYPVIHLKSPTGSPLVGLVGFGDDSVQGIQAVWSASNRYLPEVNVSQTIGTYSMHKGWSDLDSGAQRKKIKALEIRSGWWIDGFRFVYSDGSATPWRGGYGGLETKWELQDDEHFIQIYVTGEEKICSLAFVTSRDANITNTFGRPCGKQQLLQSSGTEPLLGFLGSGDECIQSLQPIWKTQPIDQIFTLQTCDPVGSQSGSAWSDKDCGSAHKKISNIHVRHGSWIDALTVTYANGSTTPRRGGQGGKEDIFNILANEDVAEIRGTANDKLTSIQFVTSSGRESQLYGKWDGYPFVWRCDFGPDPSALEGFKGSGDTCIQSIEPLWSCRRCLRGDLMFSECREQISNFRSKADSIDGQLATYSISIPKLVPALIKLAQPSYQIALQNLVALGKTLQRTEPGTPEAIKTLSTNWKQQCTSLFHSFETVYRLSSDSAKLCSRQVECIVYLTSELEKMEHQANDLSEIIASALARRHVEMGQNQQRIRESEDAIAQAQANVDAFVNSRPIPFLDMSDTLKAAEAIIKFLRAMPDFLIPDELLRQGELVEKGINDVRRTMDAGNTARLRLPLVKADFEKASQDAATSGSLVYDLGACATKYQEQIAATKPHREKLLEIAQLSWDATRVVGQVTAKTEFFEYYEAEKIRTTLVKLHALLGGFEPLEENTLRAIITHAEAVGAAKTEVQDVVCQV